MISHYSPLWLLSLVQLLQKLQVAELLVEFFVLNFVRKTTLVAFVVAVVVVVAVFVVEIKIQVAQQMVVRVSLLVV